MKSGLAITQALLRLGPAILPFADAATKELPLGRLMRLALFQVTVGMAAVLLIGTLNRVMIVELAVPAWIVAVMLSLPLLFAPCGRWSASARTRTARCSAGGGCPTSGSARCCNSAGWRLCRSPC
ncbi:hypothetical protein GCM10025880_26760 [Methylorubrum aminovorans]|nr:hypothetical protein GCM10025880_26760 [Methylorubrum aminovorans]